MDIERMFSNMPYSVITSKTSCWSGAIRKDEIVGWLSRGLGRGVQ